MPYSLARVKVADYSKWKPKFDQLKVARKASGGAKQSILFRDADNPNDITILTEWDNLDNAHKYNESKEVKEAIDKSGVTEIAFYYLNEIEKVKI